MAEKTLYIMRGLPGSGKSTLVEKLGLSREVVCSADHFFEDEDGEYVFDPTKLGAAHDACFAKAMQAMGDGRPRVAIDNTSTTRAEFTPYVMLARKYGYEVVLVHVPCTVDEAVQRNTHGVPRKAIEAMKSRWEEPLPFDPKEIRIETLLDLEEVQDPVA